ncbi:hypothetical protein C8R43DRAFT_946091 [Mycena crocata]|nr:hypothetical protein C8R43DRAFT_946091 [Mycena crocata]
MFHPPNQHLNGGTTKRRNTLHEIVLARKSVQDVGEGVDTLQLRTLSMPAKPTFYDHVLHEALQNRMQELTAIAEHPSPFCSPCFADFQIDFMRLRSPDRGRNISADSTMSIPAQTSGAALIRFEPSSGYESDAAKKASPLVHVNLCTPGVTKEDITPVALENLTVFRLREDGPPHPRNFILKSFAQIHSGRKPANPKWKYLTAKFQPWEDNAELSGTEFYEDLLKEYFKYDSSRPVLFLKRGSHTADTPISGVFLKDLLAFKNCLQFPGETVLQNGYKLMRLALVAPNYPIVVKGIARNCEHRSVTRFNLAFSIAHHYWLHFKRNSPKDLGAVVDFDRLQLISVYTADQEMWVAQLAFVPPVRRWSMY